VGGGSDYFGLFGPPVPNTGFPSITVAGIQACGLTNVTNLNQNGADYPDASLDSYMGFSFRATDPADGLTYDYEYAISGLTGTQTVITKVLAAPAVSPAEGLIAGLQSQRMNQLIGNQPDLTHFLDAMDRPQVSMSALDGTGNVDASFATGPFWGQITASWADADTAESRYVLGSAGAQKKLSDNAAVGLMAEFDHIKFDDPMGRAKGDGWLVGPYVVARVPDHELYFDARALWGRTDNEVTATGSTTDNVDGIRSLLMVRASTRLDAGPYQIRPRIELARARESTGTFIDGVGTTVPAIKGAINQAAVGLVVSRDIDTAAGKLSLSGAVDGIWTNTTNGPDATYENGRGRVAFGLNYVTSAAGTFSASAFFDGIAQDGYEGCGLSLAYNLRL